VTEGEEEVVLQYGRRGMSVVSPMGDERVLELIDLEVASWNEEEEEEDEVPTDRSSGSSGSSSKGGGSGADAMSLGVEGGLDRLEGRERGGSSSGGGSSSSDKVFVGEGVQ